MNITKKAISVGVSAALLASLVATIAAPAAFAVAGTVTCTTAAGTASASAGAGGSVALPGSWQPGTVVNCTGTNGAATPWAGTGAALATTPASTATAATFVLGSALNPSSGSITYTDTSATVSTITFTLKPLSVALSAGPALDGASLTATATNAIGNGAGAGDQAGLSYTLSSGTPVPAPGCSATAGTAATAAVASAATSSVSRASQGACTASFSYTVTTGTVAFTSFLVTAASASSTWYDGQITTTAFGQSSVTVPTANGTLSSSQTVLTGSTISGSVAVGTGITGTWTATGATPASSGLLSQVFTVTATSSTVSLLWTSSGGNNDTITYTAAPLSPSVSCLPASPVVTGTSVACTFSAGNPAATFVSWTASGFTPVASTTNPQTFVAGAAGAASISANFIPTGGNGTSPITKPYTITAVPPVIPPATPGTITLSATKTVVRGGPAVDPVYTFTEGLAADWAAGQFLTVCFTDKNGGNTLTLSGGTLSGPDSLGFGASSYALSANNCFTVTLGSSDVTRLEAFSVSDLMFKASSAAVPGAILATYTTNLGGNAAYFGGTSRTASGTLAAATTAGATSLLVNLGVSSGLFVATGSGNGNYNVNTGGSNAESLTGTAGPLGGPGSGQQLLTTSAQASNHAVGEPITQTVLGLIGTLPSPGTIVDSLSLVANGAPQVLVGVANQTTVGTVTLAERANSSGLLALGTLITLKIQEPGVLFSALPTFVISGGSGLTLGSGTLSLDRTTATFTVTTADTAPFLSSIVFSMLYDVASTAKTGDAVNLAVTAGSIAIITSPVINAYIGSMIFVTSTAPTVYINENDQAMGKAVISEVAAGAISSAAGANTLYACLTTGESWTRAPWLVRTAGNILIQSPNLLTGVTQARGVQVTVSGNVNCYAWAVYTASTTASTLEIQGVDASGNPTPTARISVPNGLTPGPVYLSIGTMASLSATSGNLLNIATVAVRAFRTGIVVTADSQPFIAPGTVNGPAGSLTIAQAGPNLLVAGERIVCTVLSRTNQPTKQDTFLASANQNLLPQVSTDGATSGLQAHLLAWSSTSFTIWVDQGATVTPGGKIFVKNINYTTTADAVLGPVLVECMNAGSAGAAFDQFVSNAIIGTGPIAEHVSNDSAVGSTTTGPFSTSTKVVKAGTQVTIRFQLSPSFAGARLGIYIAVKDPTTGTWGTFKPHASAYVDASGAVYYVYSTSSKAWLSFRAYYAGDATHAAAWSSGTQARWV